MKIGVMGDIHGNHLALEAVLKSAKNLGVQKLLITGDLVGYYFWPKLVLELLEPWDCLIVKGNHELMLSKVLNNVSLLSEIESSYGSGLRVALEELTVLQKDWLINLPHPLKLRVDDNLILLCHGSPFSLEEYVYPNTDELSLKKMALTGYRWIIMGHTHYPMEKKYKKTSLLNPGSVGQPRNRRHEAHWSLLDTVSEEVNFHIESYDFQFIVNESKLRHPEIPYLWEVFLRR